MQRSQGAAAGNGFVDDNCERVLHFNNAHNAHPDRIVLSITSEQVVKELVGVFRDESAVRVVARRIFDDAVHSAAIQRERAAAVARQ